MNEFKDKLKIDEVDLFSPSEGFSEVDFDPSMLIGYKHSNTTGVEVSDAMQATFLLWQNVSDQRLVQALPQFQGSKFPIKIVRDFLLIMTYLRFSDGLYREIAIGDLKRLTPFGLSLSGSANLQDRLYQSDLFKRTGKGRYTPTQTAIEIYESLLSDITTASTGPRNR